MAQGRGDFGTEIAGVLDRAAQSVERYHSLPPLKKARFRAGAGAALMALALYAAIGRPVGVFANGVGPLLVWAGALGFGLLWLLVGVAGARAPRDAMSAFWSVVALVVFGALTVIGAVALARAHRDSGAFYLEGVFIAGLVGSGVRLWLAVRGMPRDGLEQVRGQQAHGNAREANPFEAAERLRDRGGRQPQREFRD